MIGRIAKVRKRDGRLVDFDEGKIADAIYKAACATGSGDRFLAEELAGVVTLFLEKRYAGRVPGIEEIQDMVERVLIETGHARMAKAYILYRERRARAREQVSVHGESGAGPQVGNPAKAEVSEWSKGRITDALVREADLDAKVAAEVAARVEEKVFSAKVRRITTSAIRSLVEAELFLQGYGDRVGRQALVGLPRYDVDSLLRSSRQAIWRPQGPGDLKETLARALLAQYALSEVYSGEVVDAHLDAHIHIADVGAPFEWLAAHATLPASGDADGFVEVAALRARRLGEVVTREITLAAPRPGRWCDGAGTGLAAARRLLGHPALPRAAGLGLAFEVCALDPSGFAEALVREHWARFRGGAVEGLPQVVLHVPVGEVATNEGRRALLPALAAAAETGRVHVVLDQKEAALLATPWYRVPAGEAPEASALGVGGAVAVNAAALRPSSEEQLIEALDAALALALKALRQKRSFMQALLSDPSGPLYRVAAGARPLIAGEKGIDLVHLVGVRAAASALEADPAATARLAGRVRSYATVRLSEESRQMRLRVVLAPERDGEAARRFFRGEPQAEEEEEAYALPPELSFTGVEPLYDAIGSTLVLRFPRESAPAPESLYDALSLLSADARVGAVRLAPWPDRSVRASAQAAADL